MNTKKYDHITPVLFNLHWLPVFYRIHFKILMLTFKAIYNMSPSYISNLVSIESGSVYSLRSISSLTLDRPKGRLLSTLGARSFHAAPPTLWNSLPANIRDTTSFIIFKEKLKAYLFNYIQYRHHHRRPQQQQHRRRRRRRCRRRRLTTTISHIF